MGGGGDLCVQCNVIRPNVIISKSPFGTLHTSVAKLARVHERERDRERELCATESGCIRRCELGS